MISFVLPLGIAWHSLRTIPNGTIEEQTPSECTGAFNPLQLFMFEVISIAAWNFGFLNWLQFSVKHPRPARKTLSLQWKQRCLCFRLSSLCQQSGASLRISCCRPLHSTFSLVNCLLICLQLSSQIERRRFIVYWIYRRSTHGANKRNPRQARWGR